MNKQLLALLFAAVFCVGTAGATSTSSISCLPGATVISTGPGSTPPLSGTAICTAYSAPSGNVLTSVVLSIEGDMESPDGTGTFTYGFTLTNFSPVSAATEVIGASGNVSGPFTWTIPTACTSTSDVAICTIPTHGATFPQITVAASGNWAAGSAGLLGNGAETFNVTVVYNYGPPPTASCGVITGAVQGVAITPTAPLVGSGGAGGPYTFSATGLPAGLTMAANGSISGTPSVSVGSPFSYTVTVTDSAGNTGTFTCSVAVSPPPTASCGVFTGTLVQNVAITPTAPLVGSGGVGGPYTFSATGLPAGLTMASNGIISGTPTVSGGPFSYTVTVADSAGNKGTFSCSVSIGGPPTASCGVITGAVQGVAITPVTLVGTGGAGGPYTFSATGLPAGLTMSASGTISGTPSVNGTFPYTVTVTDKAGNVGPANTCSVTVAPPSPPTANCASISAVLGVAISPITVTGSGGAGGPYTFSATGLPAGLTMSTGGTISGTPTVSGTFPYTVTVTDSAGNKGTVDCSVTILPTPPPPGTCFFVSYAANLSVGESYINLINTGAAGAPLAGPGFGPAVGNICVNTYTFDPQEEEVSCCSCLLTPNAVANLGVNRDLLSTTLTGVIPSSVVIKLVCTLAGGDGTGTSCNQNAAVQGFQTPSLVAFGTTVQAAGSKYSAVEHPFIPSTLSASEYASITGRCASILANGSGFGICNSCQAGALGATKK
jgi:hypothetical protein